MRTENKDKELNHRHFIGLRLTDVELDLLDQGAACLSVSRSEYLRKLLLEKQIHHQIEVVADMNDLRKLVSEYGKIGSNLNQIAKHFNSGGSQSRAIENEIHQCIICNIAVRKHSMIGFDFALTIFHTIFSLHQQTDIPVFILKKLFIEFLVIAS